LQVRGKKNDKGGGTADVEKVWGKQKRGSLAKGELGGQIKPARWGKEMTVKAVFGFQKAKGRERIQGPGLSCEEKNTKGRSQPLKGGAKKRGKSRKGCLHG